MKRSLSLFAAALALGLAAAAQSRADTIPSVSFQWVSVAPVSISASQWVNPANHGAGLQNDASGGVFFIPETGGSLINQETQTAATGVFLTTGGTVGNPDQILAPPGGSNYSEKLEITRDYTDSHGNAQTAVADITFKSLLTGTMVGSYTDPITNKVVSAVAVLNNAITGIGVTGQGTLVSDSLGANPTITVQVGDALVKVDYLDFSPIEPGQHVPGAISFDITPSAAGSIQGNPTPEPSSIVLGCMGLSCLGGVFWRARRRKAAGALNAAV